MKLKHHSILFLLFSVLTIVVVTGCSSVQPVSSETEPIAGLRADYDDAWVDTLPDIIGGFDVLFVGTPKNTACSTQPVLIFQSASATAEDHLQQNTGNIVEIVQAIDQIPSDTLISFVGPGASVESIEAGLNIWNDAKIETGCIRFFGPSDINEFE